MRTRSRWLLGALVCLVLLGIGLNQVPAVRTAVAWRYEKLTLYVRNLVDPIGPAPTALPVTAPAPTPTLTAAPPTGTTTAAAPTATATAVPPPPQAMLESPPFEKQTPNNCGPATLSMALHMYGWEGDQAEIAAQIKPVLQDRNVNPEEMAYYVRNFAGWLNVEYRVNGDLELLKRLLAARYPVMVESTTSLDPNDALGASDDLWAAHYLLLTGYDDATMTFTAQDSYHGANQLVPYTQLAEDWAAFNHLYMVVFLPEEQAEVAGILGADWDAEQNRLRALAAAEAATKESPDDAFEWFNLGSNLVYFERYEEAARAYDQARQLGLPQRMFRYQFGPFLAYFHSNRNEDLLLLANYALGWPGSEEAWLWQGWGLYRKGDVEGAVAAWNKALSINPSNYVDARFALQRVGY